MATAVESAVHTATHTDFLNLHQQIRIIGFVALVSLIPFGVVMMTSFTRLSIVFNFLRQALGTVQVPSTQIVIGLSLILTAFIMHPVIEEIHENAFKPYLNHSFTEDPEVKAGTKSEDFLLLERAWLPLRRFLLLHTRESDLQLFLEIAEVQLPPLPVDPKHPDVGPAYDLGAIPWYCLIPSFVLSELRIAFMLGFLLFMPFLVIDMIISSLLMSLGMMMLPPAMVSLPFKLLLFILVDGWRLIIQQMVNGYYPS